MNHGDQEDDRMRSPGPSDPHWYTIAEAVAVS